MKCKVIGPAVYIECPGCGHLHSLHVTGRNDFGAQWEWNNNLEAPTFSPSLLVKWSNKVCHSFIKDGKIQFLNDSTHELSGQTVDLPEWDQ